MVWAVWVLAKGQTRLAIRWSRFGRCAMSEPGTADVSQLYHHSPPTPSRHIRKKIVLPTLLNFYQWYGLSTISSLPQKVSINLISDYFFLVYVGSSTPLINVVASIFCKGFLGLTGVIPLLPSRIFNDPNQQRESSAVLTFYKDAECRF